MENVRAVLAKESLTPHARGLAVNGVVRAWIKLNYSCFLFAVMSFVVGRCRLQIARPGSLPSLSPVVGNTLQGADSRGWLVVEVTVTQQALRGWVFS